MPTFYEVLGVANNATDDEIKKAFKKIAFESHPDRNPGNAEAEARFKQANEAYQTLGDPQKRQEYDARLQGKFQHRVQFGHQDDFIDFDPFQMAREDVIRDMFARMGVGGPFHGFGRNMHQQLEVHGRIVLTLKDILLGKSEDIEVMINEEQFRDGKFSNQTHKLKTTVKVPPGLRGGTIMQSTVTLSNGVTKTINIELLQEQDSKYEVMMNGDIMGHLYITYPQAILGGVCTIELIDGKKEKIKIREGTQPGQKIRIAEQGLPRNFRDARRGDLYFVVHIDIPTKVTEEQKQQLENLQKLFEQQNSQKSS